MPLNVSQLSLNRTLTRWQLGRVGLPFGDLPRSRLTPRLQGRVSPYLPQFADIRVAEHGDTPLQS